MRVLVAAAPVANLTSAQTGAALARAWAESGARLAVVPMTDAGAGFTRSFADLTGAGVVTDGGIVRADGPAGTALAIVDSAGGGSGGLGRAVVEAMAVDASRTPDLWVEVGAFPWEDGGRGFWEATAPVHDRLRDHLHLVTTADQLELHLTGFRGITAVAGRATGMHPGDMLAADQELVDWCAGIGRPELGTTPGSGAAGGVGASVLALGGDVVTGPAALSALSGLERSVAQADLVVTAVDLLDFGTKGGDVLPYLSDLAGDAGVPLLVLCRQNWISPRELRTMGVEQAVGLCASPDDLPDGPALTRLAAPVAADWRW